MFMRSEEFLLFLKYNPKYNCFAFSLLQGMHKMFASKRTESLKIPEIM